MVTDHRIRSAVFDKNLCLRLNLNMNFNPQVDYVKRMKPSICRNSLIGLKVYKISVIACPGASLLSKITYSHDAQIAGCYAFNATHDLGQCIYCKNQTYHDDLGGVGRTCPRKTSNQRTSCLTGGTIDTATSVSSFRTNKAYYYHSGISGTTPICGNSVIALKVYEILVIACLGGWRGHISNTKLCTRGYHMCNKNDRASLLSKITFSCGIQISGCYAFNAAYDFGLCIDCGNREHQDDLGGVGMTYPVLQSRTIFII
ncbi:hypothetical protein TrispH2_011678 [Trichoplax sp. H2]|nr:hypothetical protein TrispH2_011678 [Trichoplax sp. H2]|eukprot:RDD36245.1 hypothetical protein TrispH2_011678 [Trichoplax sp. H2]